MGDLRDDNDAINSENTAYLMALHTRWQHDPQTVDPAFAALFAALGADAAPPATRPAPSGGEAESLRNAFRLRGHLCARLDPLGLRQPAPVETIAPPGADRALVAFLNSVYCGPIGAEFMHLQDPVQRQWWIDRLETPPARSPISPERILSLLTHAEGFEDFCQKRFTGMRRFGLEGGESLIVALQTLVDASARAGVNSLSLGMPHRGRLNVMANILRKPLAAIFSEFRGASFKPDEIQGSGDVKYHLGTSTLLKQEGRSLRLSLLANPSHLEAVDPVVLGRVRADQDQNGDRGRNRHLGILVHGDAAFSGQGVVYETLSLCRLEGYRTGGTVHLIVNNQIGFTTAPEENHSGIWTTDVAKTVQAPILHVNGDDPEAVARCALLAHLWRSEFQSDVVIDIIGYRRHGHNETDDPAFTQPAMVHAIQSHPPIRRLYAERLIREKILAPDRIDALWQHVQDVLQREFDASADYRPDGTDWLDNSPQDPTRLQDDPERIQPMTGVPQKRLRAIGEAISTVPADFAVHPRLARQLAARGQTIAEGKPVDWATAEALAFGTLAADGHPVRLSGQDSRRGTFSQRHAVLVDQKTGAQESLFSRLAPHQAPVRIWNSPLSEYAVLGFEYGYSLGNPEALVLWEAQFGDFANGAQIIIDQFIASGETKWLRTSGLTLLLPHGYEGGGPEHSSARPERFLQLCAENNLRVCHPSTPANYFHALRRQIARRCRKPLVIFSPKSLLRNRRAVSEPAEMGPHTRFRPVLPDPSLPEGARKIVLCSGKIFYDLLAAREERGLKDIALIRLEQLYPFPHHPLLEELGRHPDAERIVWCQEEPRNGGAWSFVDRRIERTLSAARHRLGRPDYVGRDASASPATGLSSVHALQQEALIEEALAEGSGA